MKELLPYISRWISEKKPFAIARVIQTWGSSPRPVGSASVISSDMEMAGSVSGGCVEGAVMKESKQIIADKRGKQLSYGVSDDDAWTVGLTCGGNVQIYLQSFPMEGLTQMEVWQALVQSLQSNSPCVLVTELNDGITSSTLVRQDQVLGPDLPESVRTKAMEAYDRRLHGTITEGDKQYFIHVFPRRSQLLIIGAAHITADLVQLARLHDFETIVIDPRSAFANNTQFTVAPDRIIEMYPSEVLHDIPLDAYSYAVILSHDPKIDDNALEILLRSKVAYIGALGSRKTNEKRADRLKKKGFSEEEIARIEAPIGISIHAQGAREIALSIMGSVIKVKNTYLQTKPS